MKSALFLAISLILASAIVAYAKFGTDLSFSLGAGGSTVSGPVEPTGNFLKIDGSSHYLYIDGSSNKLKIDGAS